MNGYVLIITLHADPAMPPGYHEWGGTHTYMKELLDEYGRMDISCVLVTRKSMPQLASVEHINDSCTIFRIVSGEAGLIDKTKLKFYHDEHLKQVKEIIVQQGEPPSVIHSVYWNSGRLALALSEDLHIPFVHSIISNSRGRVRRGAQEPVPDRADYEQAIYDKAARLICVSEDERRDLEQLYHIPSEKIVVAGQYIHPSFLLPAHNRNGFPRMNSGIGAVGQEEIAAAYNDFGSETCEDHFWAYKTFTYMGRMDMTKGLNHIFAAWYRLFNRYGEICPPLWLAGGSLGEIQAVREQVRQFIPDLDSLERRGRLVWWGCLDPEGLSMILLKTAALITHSLYEPGGRVAVEAMSEGVPVLATPNGFAKDSIRNWREGFLVEYGDADGLARRMEHFIRQPYLSAALGLNAKQTAEAVIRQWDFTGRHLASYIGGSNRQILPQGSRPDYFSKRKIDLFPYHNEPFSEKLLTAFFTRCTGKVPIRVDFDIWDSCTSDVCKVVGEDSTYVIKRVFTRLAVNPLFNPICAREYVRRADKQYQVELKAYQRQGSPVLAGHDDMHYFLLLRELEPYDVTGGEELLACIRFLLHRPNTLKEEEARQFDQITRRPVQTSTQIEDMIAQMNRQLGDYYFEVSGVFSNHLCWKIAPHLIEYNRQSLGSERCRKLERYAADFAGLLQERIELNRLRNINTDTELKHFRLYRGELCLIDLEKNSIGTVENDIAGLLFDYLMHHEEMPCSEFWGWILNELRGLTDLDLNAVISGAAFRFFYEYMISFILHRNDSSTCAAHMNFLHQLLSGAEQ